MWKLEKVPYGTVGAVVALVYFLAGKLGLSLAFVHISATAVWAPTGIALASFLIWGSSIWPAIFLGAFFVNLTTSGSVATSLGIALGNTLEGCIGAALVGRYAGGINAFDRPSTISAREHGCPRARDPGRSATAAGDAATGRRPGARHGDRAGHEP